MGLIAAASRSCNWSGWCRSTTQKGVNTPVGYKRFVSARGALFVPLFRFQCGYGLFQLFQFLPGTRQHP